MPVPLTARFISGTVHFLTPAPIIRRWATSFPKPGIMDLPKPLRILIKPTFFLGLRRPFWLRYFPASSRLRATTAVWLQVSWIFPLLVSLYYYFHILRRFDAAAAFAATLPFVALPVLFAYDGGLSDFRMDLGLYLFFGLAGTWFLATYHTEHWYPWIFLGIAAGLAGLERATAQFI